MDPKANTKNGDNQLSTCLVMTQMNQSVIELNLFSVIDSSINKSHNLSDLWSLDVIGINDPVHLDDNDKALDNNTVYYDGV